MLRVAHDAAHSRFLVARRLSDLIVEGVAFRARVAHALTHSIAFIAGGVTVGAFGASLPPPGDVDEMKLLHQVALEGCSPQSLPFPLRLRNACPLPFTLLNRVSNRPSVRCAELPAMRDHPVVMAGCTTGVCNQSGTEVAAFVFTVTICAAQAGGVMFFGN